MQRIGMLSLVLQLLLIAQPTAAQLTSCNVLGRIGLVFSGPGFCRATAQASCDAVSIQQVQVNRAINSFFTEEPCSTASAQSAARSVATAIASVWADSLLKVECMGKNVVSKGCGFAESTGSSLSAAWTEAIAIAVAGATAPDGSRNAFCVADIRAAVPVFASAFASAQSQMCTRAKGPIAALAFQNSAARSFAQAAGEVFATATASYCGKNAQSACEGEGGATGPSSAGSSAEGEGGVFIPPGQGSGSSTGGAGGSGQAQFHTPCLGAVAKCCFEEVYPCMCAGCAQGTQFVNFDTNSFSKVLSYGGNACTC